MFSRTATLRPCFSKEGQVRNLWNFVNMMFNKPDPERIKLAGPDRACAEWILRNGGAIRWANGEVIRDYNLLPPIEIRRAVIEIDASNCAISHYGFPHLVGCLRLEKIILHNASYIDNRAIKGLDYAKETLKHVQVSQCVNVTDHGVQSMISLYKLEDLVLFNLPSVTNLQECVNHLQSHLRKCKIHSNAPCDTC